MIVPIDVVALTVRILLNEADDEFAEVDNKLEKFKVGLLTDAGIVTVELKFELAITISEEVLSKVTAGAIRTCFAPTGGTFWIIDGAIVIVIWLLVTSPFFTWTG